MKFVEKKTLKKLKQGNPKAFELLFNKYHHKLYNFILSFVNDSYEAENIVQDVFVTVWETKHRINIESSFGSLVYRIAKNKALNCLRKSLNKKLYLDTVIQNQKYFEFSTDKTIDYKELTFYFNKYVDELPERRQEIFLLSANEGLTYKEIARKLNITENTVDTQIRNALNYIRENIAKQFSIFKYLD